MKIYEKYVGSCYDCPGCVIGKNNRYFCDESTERRNNNVTHHKVKKTIPDWCPLEDSDI